MDQVGVFVKFQKAKWNRLVPLYNFKRLKWIGLVPL